MALRLGELSAVISADDNTFERDLDRSERRFDRFGRRVGDVLDATERVASAHGGRAGTLYGDQFVRGADGRLRDLNGRFVRSDDPRLAGERGGREYGDGFVGQATRIVGPIASALGTALGDVGAKVAGAFSSRASSKIASIAAGMIAVSAAAAAAGSAAYAAGAAIGSIPALAAGGGFALGTLVVGLLGIADAFKKTTSSGGGAKSVVDQVARAERGLAQAQKDVLRAQEDLNRAIEDEVEAREDQDRSIRRAKLSETGAAQDLSRARKDLAEAGISGDRDRIIEAQIAYQSAALAVEEAKDQTSDLSREQQRGSTIVRDALDRQEQAVDSLADAEDALRQAQSSGGGGGGAGVQTMKLAASAAAAVAAIKRLKPAFENLRLAVQERLFAGVGEEIRKIASVWMPQAKSAMVGFAGTFNSIFKIFSSSIQQPAFVSSIMVGVEAVRGVLEKFGNAVAGPFVDAMGRMARASKPFIEAFGDKLTGVIIRFADWIKRMDESGKLDKFFKDATDAMKDLWSIGGSVVSIFGSIIQILFGGDKKADGKSTLKNVKEDLDKLAERMKDPVFQERMKEWVATIEKWATRAEKLATWIGKIADLLLMGPGAEEENGKKKPGTLFDQIWNKEEFAKWRQDRIKDINAFSEDIVRIVLERWQVFSTFWSWVGDVISLAFQMQIDRFTVQLDSIVLMIQGLPGRISKAAAGMWDGIRDAFRDAINWIITRWNSLSFGIPSVDIPGVGRVGGATLNTPDIPRLASGGTVMRPGMAFIAERAPEAVYLPGGAQVRPLDQHAGGGGVDMAALAKTITAAMGKAQRRGDVIVSVDGEVIERRSLSAISRNPQAVATAAKSGARTLAYAG